MKAWPHCFFCEGEAWVLVIVPVAAEVVCEIVACSYCAEKQPENGLGQEVS